MTRACAVLTDQNVSMRIQFGVDLLTAALRRAGFDVVGATADAAVGQLSIIVGTRTYPPIAQLEQQDVLLYNTGEPGDDGYYLSLLPGQQMIITGGNESGVLYGCQELARILDRTGDVPRDLDRGETPDMVLRGPAIGLQKTTVEPPRQVYEYPITPDRFPWFYDRTLWIDVLDTLFEQRANVIYLWSGHPFSSLIRLSDYREALEVTDAELAANQETLLWLTAEADRRGIWIVIKFYNIHIPLPFAEHHRIPLHQPRPTPLVSAYTKAAVTGFVKSFPQVGLYVCLGEVLQGDLYGREWFLDTILSGVVNGIAATASPQGTVDRELPPVILRSHNIDPAPIVEAARSVYPRLFTEAKYNGESFTTWNPRGAWQEQHRFLSSLGSTHIANVHILANLEPFRFGAVSFIQRSVQAMKHRLGANGLHLYPLFYWDWPISPDRMEPRPRQLDRDWIWYAAWHRYAWKADRDPVAEHQYWTDVLTRRFGTTQAGIAALDAYESMGQIAPRLIRRIGITEGNRQTFSLGMTMSQLTNPTAHRPWRDLWESHAPAGERLDIFVERQIAGLPHVGETPIDVINDARHFARLAVHAVGTGLAAVTKEHEDFQRLQSDAEALAELAEFYALRVEAAIDILSYRALRDTDPDRAVKLLKTAVEQVSASVLHYRRLVHITQGTYLYANSMRTPQRKVPFPDGARYGHWSDCLPQYEAELTNLRANVASLAVDPTQSPRGRGHRHDAECSSKPYRPAEATIATFDLEPFILEIGERVLNDTDSDIWRIAPELDQLPGARMAGSRALGKQVAIDLELPEPAYILIGYFRSADPRWLQVPNLETNTHADDRGGLEPVLRDAIGVQNHPPVDIHAFRYEEGKHTIALGTGAYLLAGVVAIDQEFTPRDAGQARDRFDTLDWLYEEPDLLGGERKC